MVDQIRSTAVNDLVTFLRKRDYRLVRELGEGACGKTVLLHDDQIDKDFVCKKYAPYSESQRENLYLNFVKEIKLLHDVYHPNVIRVYNYYLYPESFAGYILMEFVDGSDVESYVKDHPEQINDLFAHAVRGFAYLERVGILHRDIRPGNIMVDATGHLKIIDLGFSKQVHTPTDFKKSITLNWWCQPPNEILEGQYDFSTEVYFVGKLFEQIIQDYFIQTFSFSSVLRRMCQADRASRVLTFSEVERAIEGSQLPNLDFSSEQIRIYREFSDAVWGHISKIENQCRYVDDPDRFQTQLNEVYRRVMLEEFIPDAALVLRQLLTGNYYYLKPGFSTHILGEFVQMLRALTAEQLRVLIANLHTRLDQIPRFGKAPKDLSDDEVPF